MRRLTESYGRATWEFTPALYEEVDLSEEILRLALSDRGDEDGQCGDFKTSFLVDEVEICGDEVECDAREARVE